MSINTDIPQFFQGVVEDIDDPLKLGRVKVRVFGIHSKLLQRDNEVGLATEDLYWCDCGMPVTSASSSGVTDTPRLQNGTWVYGVSRDGELFQDLLVMGSLLGRPKNLPDITHGFNDPDGVYPKEDYIGQSDVNRLARNEDIENTIIPDKRKDERKSVPTATGEWTEPTTKYDAKYPHNKVTESESGHIHEIDDTEGKERLHWRHREGSFKEVHPDGTVVYKIVGDDYQISVKDKHLLVEGNMTITVNGNAELYIKGNANTLVDKNEVRIIKGNLDETVEGNKTVTVNGNSTTNVDKDESTTIGGNATEDVSGTVVEKASSYTTDGHITQSGGIDSDADINTPTEVTAGIIKLTSHKHPTAAPGPPSPPIP